MASKFFVANFYLFSTFYKLDIYPKNGESKCGGTVIDQHLQVHASISTCMCMSHSHLSKFWEFILDGKISPLKKISTAHFDRTINIILDKEV